MNLLTGDYTLAATDASAFGMTVSRTASSRQPDAGARQEGQAAIFGPEWTSGTVAELTESDYTMVRKSTDTAVQVVFEDGSEISFTANAARTGWVPEPGAEDLTLTGSVTGSFTLTDTDGVVTTFAKVDPAATTWTVTSSFLPADNSTTQVVSQKVVVDGKTLARPWRIIAPTSAVSASTCQADPATKGCRVLEFVYATTTTATGTQLGDVAGQVSEIKLWATPPGGAASVATAMAKYAYDASGRLRETWDPRISPALKTAYEYDAAGRVTKLTPPGQLPWTFTYGRAGDTATAGDGMLLAVSRPTLQPGTTDQVNGEAKTSIVYGVPLSGSNAPYAMGSQDVQAWGQAVSPTDATAIFPADMVPASNTGGQLAATDYGRATVHYLDASGREVNTIDPARNVTTTEYDKFGNEIRSLSAANRALALGGTPADQARLAELGISDLPAPERARLLSETSVYSADGLRETDEYGPLRLVVLVEDLKAGDGTVLVAAGSQVAARAHTVKVYDEGRPTDGSANAKDLVTTETVGAEVRGHEGLLADARVTKTEYDWGKGLPTKTIQDPGGLAITRTTAYDAQGRVIKTTMPASNGSDAGTTLTTYWSATGSGTCAGRPEWADLECQTQAAGSISGGGSNPTELPVETSEYTLFGSVAKVTETANGVTRTTTTTFDAADRPVTVTVSGGVGAAVPEVTTEYDPATGKPVRTTSPTGGTITRVFDKLGREVSYTDADGGVTTTEYDLLDRPTKVTDNVPSTVTYTYDHVKEPRGLATQLTDSVAGVFTASYDPDGSLSVETLPGGYTLRQEEDTTGTAVERVYTRDADGQVILSDAVAESVHGQWLTHTGTSSRISTQAYRYDKTGRLVQVDDTVDNVCTRRTYAFDANSNRLSKTTAAGLAGDPCPTGGGTVESHTYDSAGRLVDPGYGYDAFGRTTTLPGGVSVEYYANDLAYRQTVGGQRQTWALDAGLRFRSWTVETDNAGTWQATVAKVNHYDGDSDNPRWILESTTEGGDVTRNVDSLADDLAATTSKTGNVVLQLTNLHGDVNLQLPLDPNQAPVVLEADEYGIPRDGTPPARYGWLGGKQRSAETLTGHHLMGARLYTPTLGRFLQVDQSRAATPAPTVSAAPSSARNSGGYSGRDLRHVNSLRGTIFPG